MVSAEPPSVRVGCAGLPPRMSRQAYFERLAFLEIARPPQLTDAAVARWRKEVPATARVAVAVTVGPRDLSAAAVVAGPAGRLAAALEAEVIVVQTPPEVTPSASNRSDLQRFFGELGERAGAWGGLLAWRPAGLWEPAESVRLAAAMGALWAFDPVAPDPLDELSAVADQALAGGQAYLRPGAAGRGRGLRDDELEALAELCAGLERAWVAFEGVASHRMAARLSRALEQATDRA